MPYRTTERTEARRAETRKRIVTAARELIAEGGYIAAQIAAVAARAGVAVGPVYRHFRHSYRDLMAEVLAAGVEGGDLPPQDVDATAAALIGAIGETMLGPLSPTHSYNGSFHHETGRSSRSALALRPRTTDPEALI